MSALPEPSPARHLRLTSVSPTPSLRRDHCRWPLPALVGVVACAVCATLAQASEPTRGFEITVIPGAEGPNRLELSAELLAHGRPLRYGAAGAVNAAGAPDAPRFSAGLEDLRLLDSGGREVPYLLVPPADRRPPWQAGTVRPAGTQAFEVDLGAVRPVDLLRLGGLPTPLLERLAVEGSGDRTRWVELVAERSIADLPDEKLRLLEVPLVSVELVPPEVRYLRITWSGRRRQVALLPGSVEVRLAEQLAAARPNPSPVFWPAGETDTVTSQLVSALRASARPTAVGLPTVVPLAVERLASEPGISRFRLVLPGPGLPISALLLAVESGELYRPARVVEARLASNAAELVPVELGRTVLRRLVRADVAVTALRIPLDRPRELELDLEVEDGDNPPLELAGAGVELLALPWVYFESPDGAPLTARVGDPDATAPRYDLEAARVLVAAAARAGDGVETTEAQSARAAALPRLARARLESAGRSISLAAGRPESTTVAAGLLGSVLATDRFTWRRELTANEAGLVVLPLDVEVARATRSLGELRLLDATSRQIPYLLETRPEPLVVPLAVTAASPTGSPDGRESRYRLQLAGGEHSGLGGLPASRLVITSGSPVFARRVRVEIADASGRSANGRAVLATADWRHGDPSRSAPALVLPLPALPAGPAEELGAVDVEVVVEDGDNAPLALRGAELLLPAYRLRFVHPGGVVALLGGDSGLPAPRYDLALLGRRLLGTPARELALGPPQATGGAASATARTGIFWLALVAAVSGLLLLLGRLVRPPAG